MSESHHAITLTLYTPLLNKPGPEIHRIIQRRLTSITLIQGTSSKHGVMMPAYVIFDDLSSKSLMPISILCQVFAITTRGKFVVTRPCTKISNATQLVCKGVWTRTFSCHNHDPTVLKNIFAKELQFRCIVLNASALRVNISHHFFVECRTIGNEYAEGNCRI